MSTKDQLEQRDAEYAECCEDCARSHLVHTSNEKMTVSSIDNKNFNECILICRERFNVSDSADLAMQRHRLESVKYKGDQKPKESSRVEVVRKRRRRVKRDPSKGSQETRRNKKPLMKVRERKDRYEHELAQTIIQKMEESEETMPGELPAARLKKIIESLQVLIERGETSANGIERAKSIAKRKRRELFMTKRSFMQINRNKQRE